MPDADHTPYWLEGELAPVHEEITVLDLEIEGTLPPKLRGLYARNGSNPRDGHAGHWFSGDGMLHGVSLKDGRAEWYRNRWVRTPRFEGTSSGAPGDIHDTVANTSIVAHAGRTMALVENALPMRIGRELETLGLEDFGGKLTTPVTAHPKICPATGELHFFGYSPMPPFLTYHMADAAGVLQRSLEIPVKAPTMVHDFALTSGHVVFMDLPVMFDMEMAQRGAAMPFAWSDSYGARLGILPRGAGAEALRWVEVEPCYVFHVGNAYEEADGTIVLDVAWYDELWRGGASDTAFESARLKRWRVASNAAKATEEFIGERAIEFPRIDDRRTGTQHGFVYAVETGSELGSGRYDSVLKYDVRTGRHTAHVFEGGLPSEFVHVPDPDRANEEDGWLMGFVYDRARDASDLIFLEAGKIEAKPVARVKLPRRVPQGFHGNWLPDA